MKFNQQMILKWQLRYDFLIVTLSLSDHPILSPLSIICQVLESPSILMVSTILT